MSGGELVVPLGPLRLARQAAVAGGMPLAVHCGEGSGVTLRPARTDVQFLVPGGRIMLAAESPFRQEHEQDFDGGSHQVAVDNVTSDDCAIRTGHRHVQMRSIGRQASRERNDLRWTGDGCRGFLPCEADLRVGKTADAADDERRAVMPGRGGFKRRTEIGAWRKPQRSDVHDEISRDKTDSQEERLHPALHSD